MQRRTLLASTLLAASGTILAGMARAAPAAAAEVTIDNFTFTPPVLTVAAGTRVTWTNHDDIPHTVVSRETPAAKRSPVLDTGDSYSLTFDKRGNYGFFCSLHPHMQSQVVVQ